MGFISIGGGILGTIVGGPAGGTIGAGLGEIADTASEGVGSDPNADARNASRAQRIAMGDFSFLPTYAEAREAKAGQMHTGAKLTYPFPAPSSENQRIANAAYWVATPGPGKINVAIIAARTWLATNLPKIKAQSQGLVPGTVSPAISSMLGQGGGLVVILIIIAFIFLARR